MRNLTGFESFDQFNSRILRICLLGSHFQWLSLLSPSFSVYIHSTDTKCEAKVCLYVVCWLKFEDLSFVELGRLVSGLWVDEIFALSRKQNIFVQIKQVFTLYVCETMTAFPECNTKVYKLFDY